MLLTKVVGGIVGVGGAVGAVGTGTLGIGYDIVGIGAVGTGAVGIGTVGAGVVGTGVVVFGSMELLLESSLLRCRLVESPPQAEMRVAAAMAKMASRDARMTENLISLNH